MIFCICAVGLEHVSAGANILIVRSATVSMNRTEAWGRKMLLDWSATEIKWDDDGARLDITFRAVPSPADEEARPLTGDDVEPILVRTLNILNSYAHLIQDP